MNRYFIGTSEQPRVRRAGDVVAIALSLILLVGTAATYGEASATDLWILDLLETLPSWFDDVWRIGYFLGLVLMVAVFAGAVVGRRRSLVRDMTIVVVATITLGFVAAWLFSDAVPTTLPELTQPRRPHEAFPIIRVAVVTGAILVAAPHLARPVRWFGWGTAALVAISGFGLGYGLPSDALGAIGLGLAAGGGALRMTLDSAVGAFCQNPPTSNPRTARSHETDRTGRLRRHAQQPWLRFRGSLRCV